MTISTPRVPFAAGQALSGFVVNRIEPLPDIRAVAIQGEHIKSGAQWLHLYTESDTENCFCVSFPTPPSDDTGLPHIMEHAVLGGSRKFPVREPFFEMVKSSMATFINAMTGQAYTTYPIATNVRKDYFNLATVYLDAVFHPELKEQTFRREGHHLALENNDNLASALKISGIVYNEMKGAYSAPERLLGKLSGRGLFPDIPLGRDSGGDPEKIPDLTYEQFQAFHRQRYHPSNAMIFMYGDIPTDELLRFLQPVLDEFDRIPVATGLDRQPRWSSPRALEDVYPIGPEEETSGRTFCVLNWLVGDALDPLDTTAWEVLGQILVGNDSAPLKKAIIDSKLGADLVFSGTGAWSHELCFHVGLKGTERDRVEAFEGLVLDTLRRIASEPIARERVDAAFQQLAYDRLEVQTLFPMHLLSSVNAAWPYGADPLTHLRMRQTLEECRQRYETDPELFQRMIQEGLIANAHRLRVLLVPDREAQQKTDAALTARMQEKRAKLDEAQIATIAREAAALQAAQGVPNPPEQLAKLPQLGAGDLPRQPRSIPTATGDVNGFTVLRHDVFSNGVVYLELDADLAGLPADAYRWLPEFCDAVNKLGAAGQSYDQIAQRRAGYTGGLSCGVWASRHATDTGRTLRRLRIGLKTLDGQVNEALRLVDDLVFGVDPRDRERLRDTITQARAAYRTHLVNQGLTTASRHAARGLSLEGALTERWFGTSKLRDLEELVTGFDTRADEVMARVEQVRDFLLNRRRWTVSYTGSDEAFRWVEEMLGGWGTRMRDEAVVDRVPPFEPYAILPREALAGPMPVAYCAGIIPVPRTADPLAPLFAVGSRIVSYDYFLPEIRYKGNAYGGGAQYDPSSGTWTMTSFRDPRIVETLAIFDGTRSWVAGQQWSETDIHRAIIGCAKEEEKPIRPGEATRLGLARHLRGMTDALRARQYEALIGATPLAVKQVVERVLAEGWDRSAICVVSSKEKLAEANKALGDHALQVTNILG
jgi:hypothetical protein